MSEWIKAMNPTAPITTEPEALRAARASAIAIFLGVAWGVVGVALLLTTGAAAMEAAMAQAAADSPEVAGMTGAMTQIALWGAIGLTVIQLVLGLVQWTKPNIVIPIIFLILVLYGLATSLFGLSMMGSPDIPAAAKTPMWQIVLGLLILLIQLVMHIAGIRGARALDKLRMDAAQTY